MNWQEVLFGGCCCVGPLVLVLVSVFLGFASLGPYLGVIGLLAGLLVMDTTVHSDGRIDRWSFAELKRKRKLRREKRRRLKEE